MRRKAMTRDAVTIRRLTELLVAAAKPNRIIMFGSQARGKAGEDSDLDVMVIEEDVSDRVGEMRKAPQLTPRPLARATASGWRAIATATVSSN